MMLDRVFIACLFYRWIAYPKSIIEPGLPDHDAGILESMKRGAAMYVGGRFCLKARRCTYGVKLAFLDPFIQSLKPCSHSCFQRIEFG